MPYQYAPIDSRYTNTIADLLLRRGDVEAQRAQQLGAIEAERARSAGQIWGGLINSLGQLPGQIQQAKGQAIQNQQQQLKLADMQRAAGGQQAMAGLMQGDQLPAGDVGPRQPSYLTNDGLFDVQKITARLGQLGYGDRAADLVKSAEGINDAILKHTDLQQKAAQQHALLLGDLADGALKLSGTGMSVTDAMDFVVQPALATKRFSPDEYAQVRRQISALPPEQQNAALTTLMDQAAKLDKTETLSKDAQRMDRYGRIIASNVQPEKPTEASLALAAAGGDDKAREAMNLLKPERDTGAALDARFQNLQAKVNQGVPLSVAEKAEYDAYKTRKTLGADTSAKYAADRQAATIAQQIAQQQRAQSFTEAQAGRKELTDKVEIPYIDAREKTDTLRRVVEAAKSGNKIAAAETPLLATLGIVTSEGVKRINRTEVDQVQGAGSLYDKIRGKLGSLTSGQPMPKDLLDDISKLADLLDKGSRDKYEEGFRSITQRYSLKDEVMKPPAGSAVRGTTGVVNGKPAVWDYRDGKWGWYAR